jgi:kumamolisin
MTNPEHLERLTAGTGSWAEWRGLHPDVEPDLTDANLSGTDFEDADLIGADFSNADLHRANLSRCKLAGAIFAGAEMTGAQLPEATAKELNDLSAVKDISSNAQKLFIAMLAACLYSWLTIATTTDVNLVTNRATSSLPVIQTTIPIVGFFYIAPLLLLCAYFYFHFYLQKLWDELGALPAIFPDGKPLYSKADPWLLGDLVRVHSRNLKKRTPFLSNLQIWISVVLAWWIVPLTLLMFWARYLVRHELIGTIFHSLACAASIASAIFLYRLARSTLQGVERRAFAWPSAFRQRTWIAPVVTGLVIAGLLVAIALGAIRGLRSGSLADNYWPNQTGFRSWIPKAMTFFKFAPFADLRAAELSTKPSATDKSGKDVKGIQLSATDLRFADMRVSYLADSLLTDTDLEEADLWGADLDHAGMVGADLQGASLAQADLRGAYLAGANLAHADIKYAHFEGAQGLTADQLRGAENWCQAYFDDSQIQMLRLPADNRQQVAKWQQFDEANSALSSPTTVEAAREADLRRFASTPSVAPESASSQQKATGQSSGARQDEPAIATHQVPDLARLYNFPTGLDGSGQTIGILELGGGYRDIDLDQYFQSLNIKRPHISIVSVDGATNAPGGMGDSQVEGDIEIVGAIAPRAEIVVYFSPSGAENFIHAMETAVNDKIHHPSVISIGWGSTEGAYGMDLEKAQRFNEVLHTAADRNITVVAASGDKGARDAETENRLEVNFPASSPWVLSVGGTAISTVQRSIVYESVWNDRGMGASGGGVSRFFDRPKYQSGIRVPRALTARPGRGLPDVAINASPSSGFQALIDGSTGALGGTSVSAPMWAGLIALLNQGLGRNLGFFNPILYEKLGPAGVLRPVLIGHNGTTEMSGYCAGPGWNAATGWGSPDGERILQALKSLPK